MKILVVSVVTLEYPWVRIPIPWTRWNEISSIIISQIWRLLDSGLCRVACSRSMAVPHRFSDLGAPPSIYAMWAFINGTAQLLKLVMLFMSAIIFVNLRRKALAVASAAQGHWTSDITIVKKKEKEPVQIVLTVTWSIFLFESGFMRIKSVQCRAWYSRREANPNCYRAPLLAGVLTG